MRYVSTRGQAAESSFEEVLLTGLASDGGLFVPKNIPQFDSDELAELATLPYTELALEVMAPFVEPDLDRGTLKGLVDEAYAQFAHAEVTPVTLLDDSVAVLELFHGPTLAFKDLALQLLGRLFDHVLHKRQQKVVILGATSGDTGSAAIEGCRHSDFVDIFILHPHQRVSEVQRRQMTTVDSTNVHNIAVEGNFDDCQSIVKACFGDQGFLPEGRQLVAVNSINWARIMAQIVYYFYAGLRIGGPQTAVSFSVPTGNFGDIFAGYLARCMGLPVNKLIIATNQNDILHRMLSDNDYSKRKLQASLSPSMDIMVSSNFERLLFDLYDRNGVSVRELMAEFTNGSLHLSEDALWRARQLFLSSRADDRQTGATMSAVYQQQAYLLDPHSAIGVFAARQQLQENPSIAPVIALATAHPAKFPDAVHAAGLAIEPTLPTHMADLFARQERFTVLPNNGDEVQQFVRDHCRG